MKTVFNSSELPHIWARQSQVEGKTPTRNMYFHKDEIYSYGSHFCMAKIVNPSVVLITDRRYSNTTAGHLCEVRRAVNHFETVYCAYPDRGVLSNLQSIKSDLQSNIDVLQRDNRTRPATKERAKLAIESTIKNAIRYFEVMGTDEKQVLKLAKQQTGHAYFEFIAYWNNAKTLDFEGLAKARANVNKQIALAEKKQKAKALKEAKESIDKWLKGENVYLYRGLDEVYLRLKDETVETSMGARVSVKAAKVLFDLVKAGKDIKGFNIDGYTVIGLNGVLTIGCHKIERSEINRFASLQSWGEIPLH